MLTPTQWVTPWKVNGSASDLQVGDDAGDGFAAVPGQVDEQGEELVPAEAGDQVFPA